ncbi:hypothetical protein RFI_22983 [Reticulomyxa filosa]|uniref:Uncharacterized protein n=1 Tax=Reticulomyxa filosa TaxID=46433 RepID=X6MK76_RETFI|nr:hypothetical protein RFI_22983 [Reticulomyxa filosa]|eukprot:ETO14383.1 hypothetical protein RFI_22983 [Reticulomyxa filosa]
MFSHLEQSFPGIKKDVILKIWRCYHEDLDETRDILDFITHNETTIEQQNNLLKLLELFGTRIGRATILENWMECKQMYADTVNKLEDICATIHINNMEESDDESKIMREISMCVLWNILNHPQNIKYRQINHQALYQNLQRKCNGLNVNIDQLVVNMEKNLQEFGFQNGMDGNWYYPDNIQILWLWKCFKKWINEQPIYKTRNDIPTIVCMLKNKKWKKYSIAFDYEHRRIVLLNEDKRSGKKEKEEKLKIQSLQIGNPKKSSLELNVNIQWFNDFANIDTTYTKWCGLILNRSWHFRTIDTMQLISLSTLCSEFNSFLIIWKANNTQNYTESLNPYSITLQQGIKQLKDKSQVIKRFEKGTDELIYFKFDFEKCKPQIASNLKNENILLHDIYKYLPHYPSIQAYWEIDFRFIVPYQRTFSIQRNYLPTDLPNKTRSIPLNERSKFNPLLYEHDFQKLKTIDDTLHSKIIKENKLQKLLHEIIKNGYLCDLIIKYPSNTHQKIKQQINYNENNEDELILDDKILIILNEAKQLYHNDTHKCMGYPLQLHNICAILLYSEKSCNVEFCYDQTQFKHLKWSYLDNCLHNAVNILHNHERREEIDIELYCGLKEVRLENITKEIKSGYFITYMNTFNDLQIAQTFRGDKGCILHFHPSMRRSGLIGSCDMSWIVPYKCAHEIVFSRSFLNNYNNEKPCVWNIKLESEDEYTQMILLTWREYDIFLQQTMECSAMWNYCIDPNVFYFILKYDQGDMNQKLLNFEEWKSTNENDEKYREKMNEFVEKRCCNHDVNLYCLSIIEKPILKELTSMELLSIATIKNGLPFVKNDKEAWKKQRKG